MKPLRALIVEDSEDDTELLLQELRRGDYDPIHARVETAEAMTSALSTHTWDIVFSDFSMPQFNAFDALTLLGDSGLDIPFIIVSGTIGEDRAVTAMKAGAHDYILKGNMKRLLPAVERELREARMRQEHRQADETSRQLQELAKKRFMNIVNLAADAIISVDEEQRILIFNLGAEKIFGYTAAEMLGQPLDRLLPERFTKAHRGHIRQFATEPQAARRMDRRPEIFGRRKDGSEFPAEASISRAMEEGKFIFTVSLRDISERKQADATIHRLAYTDPVTGLPNRVRFHELVQEAVVAAQREQRPMALLLMDLDRFKDVNDTLGHDRGDSLLQQVGMRLRSALFAPDIVARLGGDEFGILLPRLAATSDVRDVVRKLQDSLTPPLIIDGIPIVVEASIGVATAPEHADDADMLIRRADIAMYRAKHMASGYAIYEPKYNLHSLERLGLMAELRDAIEQNQLLLHFQPKVEIKTSRIVGVEALVRWQHPRLGLLFPDKFIMAAEQTGLIGPLTRWVLIEALTYCQGERREGIQLRVSVNLSARSLHAPQLPKMIEEVLKATGAKPGQLMLEVTESAIVLDPQRAEENLVALSRIGVGLSIDDFGTGYTSLSSIKRLPVNEIKIDKSFVTNMLTDKKDAMIVRTVIEFGHNFWLTVVAEGVETMEVLDALAALGCDEVQGYFISKPQACDPLRTWFSTSSWKIGPDRTSEQVDFVHGSTIRQAHGSPRTKSVSRR